MTQRRKPARRFPLGLIVAVVVTGVAALFGAVGLLSWATQSSLAEEFQLQPLATLAPRLNLAAPTTASSPTPVIALATGPAPETYSLAPSAPIAASPTQPFAAEVPVAPTAAKASFVSQPSTLYLPWISMRYQPPPREPEAFVALGAASTSDWPAPLETLSQSKIGLHTLGQSDPYIMEFIRRAKPRVVKAVGDYGWLKEVKEVSPETVTIGRIYGYEEAWIGVLDPKVAAETYISQHLEQYRLNSFVDYWEGWNEFIWDSRAKLEWYTQFEAERACQMQALGFRAAVGGFAVGWPNTYDEMEVFVPALEAAQRCGGLFHLHEYNRPMLMCGVRTNQAEVIPGAPPIRVPAGPLTFRYRFWYESYLRPRNLADLPLVISEYGIDRVPAINCDSPQQPGSTWKDFGDWWRANGIGNDAVHGYINQLAWADREMQHDAYVIGATVFTAGGINYGEWDSFDIHDALIALAHYVAAQK